MKSLSIQRMEQLNGGQDFGISCWHTEVPGSIFGFGFIVCTNICHDLEGNYLYTDVWFCDPL
jgi:hypothetical protein